MIRRITATAGTAVRTRLSLRTRLASLVCGAIGLAALAAALSSYLLVSGQLRHEVDEELATQASQAPKFIQVAGHSTPGSGTDGTSGAGVTIGGGSASGTTAEPPPAPLLAGALPAGGTVVSTADCVQSPVASDNPVVRPQIGIQLVKADGTRCATSFFATPVTAADIEVAQGSVKSALHTGYTDTGQHVRVLTFQAAPGVAVTYIRPLADVDSSLGALAWRLGAVAGAGLIAAVLAGLGVARSALRPVRRFTEVVEHVARTDDLGTRVAVSGRDEIARLGVSFNDMTEALESERQRQRRLVSDAGHELRTPLTGLRTAIDLLVRSERTGRELSAAHRRTLLANADAQVGELAQLVSDLLRLSRSQESAAPARVRTAFHDAAAQAVDRARRRAPGVRIDAELEPCYVLADPGGLERAVLNLLDNAVKFSPPDGQVTVRLAAGTCVIEDQGPGIAAEDLPRVFDRFWRSASARALPGSGLGLAIVAQYAAQVGGSVSLENAGAAPGGERQARTGTIARLTVPLDPACQSPAASSSVAAIFTASPSSGPA